MATRKYMLQLIDKQHKLFRVENIEFEFTKPYYLYLTDSFTMIKGVVKGSTLCWNIAGQTITYNQIKSLLNQTK